MHTIQHVLSRALKNSVTRYIGESFGIFSLWNTLRKYCDSLKKMYLFTLIFSKMNYSTKLQNKSGASLKFALTKTYCAVILLLSCDIIYSFRVLLTIFLKACRMTLLLATDDDNMPVDKNSLFSASTLLKLIFYISTFTVLIMMFLLQKETNLDVIVIRKYVEKNNTSKPLYRLKTSSVSVSIIASETVS